MTDRELWAIKARVSAATGGPWYAEGKDFEALYGFVGGPKRNPENFHEWGHDDVLFVAHAREDIPALIAEVEELHQTINGLRATIRDLDKEH